MPVSPRLTTADATTQSFYTAHPELDMVSILAYFEHIVQAWTHGVSLTVKSSIVTELDNSFEAVGNAGQSLLLRASVGHNPRVTDGGTYGAFHTLTTAQGVDWIIGHYDPSHNETDFPHPLNVEMRDLVDRVYAFFAEYLSATSSTTVNGVTFGACPCSVGGTHARKEHVMAITVTKPTDIGTEMSIGFGTEPAINMALWNAIDGYGTSTDPNNVNVRARAQAIVDEWAWSTALAYSYFGQICRVSLAPGSVFSLWTEVNPMIVATCDTYPSGWLINICTNLEHEYAEGGDANQRNILALTHQHNQLVGIQAAGTSRQPWNPTDGSQETAFLFYAAKGMVRSYEHMLSGISCTIANNGAGFGDDTVASTSGHGTKPYGEIQFIECVPNALSFGAQNIDAFGGWPNTGSYTFKQYALTNAASANSRMPAFEPWVPGPGGSGGNPTVLGTIAS